MKSQDIIFCEGLLKKHAYRITPGRVKLLSFLRHAKKPLSVADIQKQLDYQIDKVTLYRALEDFTQSGLVAKVNLRDSVVYYEFVHVEHHHHHIVCEKCGKMEDVEICNQDLLQKEILKHAKKFKTVNSHSLEFFGLCKDCDK